MIEKLCVICRFVGTVNADNPKGFALSWNVIQVQDFVLS